MVWARIPPDRLKDLVLFGYDFLFEEEGLLWYSSPHGRMSIDKNAPRVRFDDIGEAHQCGATAMLGGRSD